MSGLPIVVQGAGAASPGPYITPECVLVTVGRGAFRRTVTDEWEPLTPEQLSLAILELGASYGRESTYR